MARLDCQTAHRARERDNRSNEAVDGGSCISEALDWRGRREGGRGLVHFFLTLSLSPPAALLRANSQGLNLIRCHTPTHSLTPPTPLTSPLRGEKKKCTMLNRWICSTASARAGWFGGPGFLRIGVQVLLRGSRLDKPPTRRTSLQGASPPDILGPAQGHNGESGRSAIERGRNHKKSCASPK